MVDVYRCPNCLGPLLDQPDSLRCDREDIDYPVIDHIADFMRGNYYDQFDENTILTAEHRQALERENDGAISRINDFYLPLIKASSLRILDAGCGNGISVDLLTAAGHDAYGIDSSALRRWQWRERVHRERLAVADGAKLPFADAYFHVVLCSGVLEHIGVEEMGGDEYRVKPLPNRDEARRAFLGGLLRVLAPGGTLYLDFPNGAFPIDFWHNTRGGSARFHSTREGFLPAFAEVVQLANDLDPRITVTAVSPNGRLRFRQVRQHWYGRAFALPMQLLFAAMDHVPRLRRSAVNPFLVIRLTKP
ncbi:MAG: class I SAM-dependent methyltransferase [Acidobacteria bacterium]|nr:class I SAM-dependent methyltransferase [Acidobacteriota bacterium]MBV9186021.1 class I SAM-dependent methyltransferase [Acidobacteriota bacterium]